MLTEHNNGSIALCSERKHLCLDAEREPDALDEVLKVLKGEGPTVLLQVWALSLSLRIVALSGVLMRAIGDTGTSSDELMDDVCPDSADPA